MVRFIGPWRNVALSICTACCIVVSSVAFAQTVTNGGFETGPFPGSPGYGTITGWSASGPGGSGINSSGMPFLNGLPIPEGTHIGFQQGQGTLSQTVTGLTVGKAYTVDYMFNERGAAGGASTAPFAQLGGSTLLSQSGYQRHDSFERALTNSYTATSTSATLAIGNSGGVGDNSLLLDAISVRRAAPILDNFDFDKVILSPSTFQYGPSGMSWTFQPSSGANGSGVSRNGSAFQTGGTTAAEGNQLTFLQGATTATQTASGFEVGAQYAAIFVYAGRSGGTGNNLNVLLGGNNIFSNGNVSGTGWTGGTTSTFTATQSSYSFSLQTTNPLGGDRTTFVDDIRFYLTNDLPTANAGGAYTYNAANLTQTFSGSGTDPESQALTYAWSEGGNSIASGATPSVGLALSGLTNTTSTASVQLVTTDTGGAFSNTANATVNYQNTAPTASAGGALSFNSSFAPVTANGTFNDADLAANALVPGFESISTAWKVGASAIGNSPNTATPTVSDGNFETAALAVNAFAYNPGGTPWTYASSGVSRDISGFQSGSGVPAPSANQIGFIQGTGSISQSVSGFTNGAVYKASWFEASRGAGNTPITANNDLRVQVDSTVISPLHVVSSPNYSVANSNNFTATQGSYNLQLQSTGNVGGDVTTFVDKAAFELVTPAANQITFAQAVAAGLTTTTSSITATFTATDAAGATGSGNTTISYTNSAPSAGSPTATVNPNYSVSFFDVFTDLDLGGNGFTSSFETLTFEFDLTQATLPGQVGDGFMTGGTSPTETTSGTLSGTLSLSQLISLFGGLGTYTAWANVRDGAGLVSSQSFTVNVVPEPSSLLVWGGLLALAAGAGYRRQRMLRS